MPILELCLHPEVVDARFLRDASIPRPARTNDDAWDDGDGDTAVVALHLPATPTPRELVFQRRSDGAWSMPTAALGDLLVEPPDYQRGMTPADDPGCRGALQLFVRLEVPAETLVSVQVR